MRMACIGAAAPDVKPVTCICNPLPGTKLKVSGRLEEGFAKYRQAASICAAYAPAFYNIGVIHSERREFAAAKDLYARAIAANPGYAEAHCNLGVIHKEEGRLEDAIAAYERALAIAPEFAIVSNNLAIALTELGTRVKVAGEPPAPGPLSNLPSFVLGIYGSYS